MWLRWPFFGEERVRNSVSKSLGTGVLSPVLPFPTLDWKEALTLNAQVKESQGSSNFTVQYSRHQLHMAI